MNWKKNGMVMECEWKWNGYGIRIGMKYEWQWNGTGMGKENEWKLKWNGNWNRMEQNGNRMEIGVEWE